MSRAEFLRSLAREWLWFLGSLPGLLVLGLVLGEGLPGADDWFKRGGVVQWWFATYVATVAVRLTMWAIRTVQTSRYRDWWAFVANRIAEPHDSPGLRLVKIATVLVNVGIIVAVAITVGHILWTAR